MNTDIEFLLEVTPSEESSAALAAAEQSFHDFESTFSRFRDDSELSRLNREGRLDEPSPHFAEVVRLALHARRWSGGRFDPTVHDALVAAGYDTTFDELPGERTPESSERAPRAGGTVEVDEATGAVALAPGVHLDLGGIAKGYAADRACDLLGRLGPCLVNAGGDIAVGSVPASGSWDVGVERGDGTTMTLSLTRGGMATSGTDRRRWKMAGRDAHHVIDPATGLPAVTDLLRVTAIGTTATEAEVLAKGLLVQGARAAAREADERGVPCVLVTQAGETVLAGGLE